MKNAKDLFSIFANAAVITVGLFVLCAAIAVGLGEVVDSVHRDGRPGSNVAEVDLYKRPTPHPLRADYPELFKTEGVVVSFGSDWCGPCKRQTAAFIGPSRSYNIVKVQIEEERWRLLWEKLNLGPSVPVTAVIEKGEVVKVFRGVTPWSEIKPYAAKAKLPDGGLKIRVGPVDIDLTDGVDIKVFRRPSPRVDLQAWFQAAREWIIENWEVIIRLALSLLLLL